MHFLCHKARQELELGGGGERASCPSQTLGLHQVSIPAQYLAVLAAVTLCTLGPLSQLASGGIAAAIKALL